MIYWTAKFTLPKLSDMATITKSVNHMINYYRVIYVPINVLIFN